MIDDPFYLSKDKSLKASLGVLSVDGNFEDSIAYFEFFVKFRCSDIFCLYGIFLYANLRRDEGNPTYGVLSLSARFYFMPILFNGALENSTLQKHYNLTSFLDLLFFNVKMTKKL